MPFTILKTKLHIPPPTQDLIIREHLFRKLDDGLNPGIPLILLSAPAGYGKTSLLSSWIAKQMQGDIYSIWISLEPEDNDPIRFFHYLVAGLQNYLPDIQVWMEDILAAPSLPKLEEILTILINQLARLEKPLLMVLDDFHVIKQPELHAAIEFLVDHSPENVHIVISSRSDPPIKIHRLRARGKIVELRMQDLRFSTVEINQLMDKVQPALQSPEILLLEEKTEGWIAGIRMALLSIKGNQDAILLLNKLSGQQRFIMDFLSEEAFNNQSEVIQEFLLMTATLDRFCAPLCDAIREKEDSREILDQLEQTNCFLIPLDDEKIWYRYHHLFNDLLKIKMLQIYKQENGFIQEIQKRAANWFTQHQLSDEALQLFIQAGELEMAAEIVESSTFTLFSAGRLHQLLSWLRLLPQELRSQRPKLNLYEAWSLACAGKISEATVCLKQVDRLTNDAHFSNSELKEMQAELQAVRSLISISSGDIIEAMKLLNLNENTFPKQSKFARSVQYWSVGYALRIKGDLDGAEKQFRVALDIAYDLNNVYSIVSTAVDLGEILRQKGELTLAEKTFRSALKRAYRSAVVPGYTGRLEAFLANLLIEKREFEEASNLIEKAISHNQEWENPNHGAYACLIKARYLYAIRKFTLAAQAMQELQKWINKGPIVATLRNSIDLMWINIWLAKGDFTSARHWLVERQPNLDASIEAVNESTEVFVLSFAKVFLADGKKNEALKTITPVKEFARNMNRIAMLIQLLVMEALLITDKNKAKVVLREALNLGLTKGFRQVFLEYGEDLLPLMEELQDIDGVTELLAVIYQKKVNHEEDILTDREHDILKWMSTGLTNAEIGKRLFIAAGTVKAHTTSIYRKLEVSNRTEAIAKAKDLNLI